MTWLGRLCLAFETCIFRCGVLEFALFLGIVVVSLLCVAILVYDVDWVGVRPSW